MKKENHQLLAEEVIEKSLLKGADFSDVVIFENTSRNISCRLGKIEEIEQSETQVLGLRTFIGKKNAITSTNNFNKDSISETIDRVIEMTKLTPEDPIPELAHETSTKIPDLDLYDTTDLNADRLKEIALDIENNSLEVKGINNSNGASTSQSKSSIYLATSAGFSNGYKKSNFSSSCSVIAGSDNNMQTDYDFDSKVFFSDLKRPSEIGKKAAENTLSKCNPKKIKTCKLDVVFHPRVARTILAHFASLVNGSSIVRGSSFLKEKLNHKIFHDEINIIDNPLIVRGLSSKPFDDEGCSMSELSLVKNGVLKNWLLDTTTSKQLSMTSNSRASRGVSSPPTPSHTNLFIDNGNKSTEQILSEVNNGFYVTDLIGQGVNLITGDYSRGASGFKIENGKISFPINEVTIADNLNNMFKKILISNDLEFLYSINSPTLAIEGMTIAGV
tara:strand:- start:1004 stop:2338 length:1335 start_codon:yes stop_codon:yes gene_type:complete